jgi:hypothetical protein
MTAHNSRNASNSRNESNNRTANTVWMLSKAGILAKTKKPATAWREATAAETIGTSQCQQQKGDPQQQYYHQQGCQQHNMNAISFRGNSPKIRQNGEKFVKKDVKSV